MRVLGNRVSKKGWEFHPRLGPLPSRERKIKDRVALWAKKNWWMTDGSSTNSMLKREVVPQPPPFSNRGSADGKEGTKNHPPICKPKARSMLLGVYFMRPLERIYLSG
jgi:hypothetical protein